MTFLTDQRRVVPIVYAVALTMSVLDTTIVNVALPSMGRDLGARADRVGLVSVAYLVSLTVFLPLAGWLGDRLGGRRAVLGAFAVFVSASLLCALATDLPELVAFRVLQGLGAAVMVPVGLAMLFRVFPPAERARVTGTVAVFAALGPASGPVLGGVLTSTLSWRAVFWVNVPVGLVVLALGLLGLEPHLHAGAGRLDLPGLVLSAAGLAGVMYAVAEGPEQGWAGPGPVTALVGGAALLVLLVLVERRRPRPLVDVRLLRDRLFAASTALYGLASVAYLGALFLAALLFQDVLGLGPLQSGLLAVPSAVGIAVGGQLATRLLYPRWGPRPLVLGGLVLLGVALASMSLVTPTTPVAVPAVLLMFVGLGTSGVFVPSQTASMVRISAADTGRAAALFNAGKQLGGAVGVACVSTVLALVGRPGGGAGPQAGAALAVGGVRTAFLVLGVVALAATSVGLTVRSDDAAPTFRFRAAAPAPERP